MAAALDLRSKEEKDAELDKRIEALRKKNEALIRRYQEIEEDRRRAEQEGVAVTAPRHRRPPEPERRKEGGLGEKPGRTERKPPAAPRPPRGAAPRPSGRPPRGEPPPAPRERGARGRRSGGRGGGGALGGPGGDAGPDRKSQEWEERRRQNIERMNEEMEKIAEYERNQRDGLQDRNPVRSFLDDPRRRGPAQDERHGGSRRHGRNWGGTDFEGVRAGLEQRGRRRAAPTMTGRERAEYARWKQEREEIDRQRLARHRQPTGQWRREWDADKTDGMFNDDAPDAEHEPPKRPPKPPTFGEFLPAPRRKRQSHGRNPSTKPYSMHDDRWEEEKEPAAQPGGADGKGAQELEAAPGGTPLQPPPGPEEDEDEDEWEDVSEEEEDDEEEEDEEEEEEDDEGSGPPSPAKAEPPLLSPRPVRDWGEEMDLAPPPHGSLRGAPPAAPPPAEPAGLSPTEQLGPPGGLPAPPQDTPQHPTQETVQQDPEGPPPGTVEITDFQRP